MENDARFSVWIWIAGLIGAIVLVTGLIALGEIAYHVVGFFAS